MPFRAWPAFLPVAGIVLTSFWVEVSAQSSQIEVLVPIKGQTSYEVIWQEAERLVQQALNQVFAQSSGPSGVEVVAIVERDRQSLPLFSVVVSRADWQRSSDITSLVSWATPYFTAEALLGLTSEPIQQAAVPRPRQVDDTDLLEADPAFRDD